MSIFRNSIWKWLLLVVCVLLTTFAYSSFRMKGVLNELAEYKSEVRNLTHRKELTNDKMKQLPKTIKVPTQAKPGEICEKRLPKVILVGSMKSGTSALLHFISFHPQIAACRKPDEPRYFTQHYENHSLEWYRQIMPCSKSNQLTMEKTPGYFYGNVSALRIKRMNHQTKILMIFKDPVEVAISLYAMWTAHKIPRVKGKTFEDMVTYVNRDGKRVVNQTSIIVWYCKYILHAQTWVNIFGKDQVYAIDGSVIETNPEKELHQLETFLGLNHFFTQKQFMFSKEKNKYCFMNETMRCLPPGKGRAHPDVSEEVISLLRDYFKPFNARIADLMGRSFVWQ